MEAACQIAFKEWAVICRALAEGKQSIILRKGGIHEGREGFRVEHREFWLFPTQFHQRPEQLVPDAEPLMRRVEAEAPAATIVPISEFVVVEEVLEIDDESQLDRLTGLHLWSAKTVAQRFHYRQPGLFLLLARVFHLPQPFRLADSSYFAGCRSWVDLPEELSTCAAQAVLDDDHFAEIRRQTHLAIFGS
jgi:hypothetical protein